MSVRRKLFWLLAATISLFVVALAAMWVIERRQLAAIEKDRFQERRTALERDLKFWGSSLDNFSQTISSSPAFLDSLKGGDKAAMDSQISDEVLVSHRVPVLWVYRADKTLLTSRNRLYADGLQDVPLPRSSFERVFQSGNASHFFAKLSAGVVEIRGRAIGAGEPGGPPVGYLFAGRLWNDDEMRELSAFTGNQLRIVEASYSTQGLELPNGEIAFTEPLNGWSGKPVAQVLVRVYSPELQHAKWLRLTMWVWAGLFIFGVITALTYGLQRWIWRPLGAIVRSVRNEQPGVFPFDRDRTELGEVARLIRSYFEQREIMLKELREERQAQRAAKDQEDQIRQSRKMEALARLAGGFGQDIANLLGVIGSAATALIDRVKDNPAADEEKDRLAAALKEASGLANELLAFSGKEVFSPKVMDLNAVIRGMEGKVREMLGSTIRLRMALEAPEGWVRVDPAHFEHVIIQLVRNAVDAMPEGGLLTIATAKTLIPEATEQGGLAIPAGTYVTLEISDTGEGMEDITKERIFEPFFTTKSGAGKAGLGLSMVYSIVRKSEGAIALESEPGRGTTFFVHLPLQQVPEHVAAAQQRAYDVEAQAVLIVEDDASVREMVAGVLHEMGIQPLTAYSADTAWVAARQHHGPLPLMLVDLVLPDATGPEVATQIATIHADAKVLYLRTGPSITPSLNEHDVLEPPFSALKLRQRITAILGRGMAHAV